MAARRVAPYSLSTPPRATEKSRGLSQGPEQTEGADTMSIRGAKMGQEDVEMQSASGSDGWETQDSMWDEEPDQGSGSSSATSISSPPEVQHRLLYRGALSVPNSAMILEGIQFIAYLPTVTPLFLSAPLPLALESMRGRSTLRLLGTTHLSPETARLDTEIDIRLHIHPQSYVTHAYFQRALALSPSFVPERTLLRSPHPHPHIDPRATTTAVRIGLGEHEIVVYGRIQSSECGKMEKGEMGKMELVVARLVEPGACSSDSDEEEGEEERGNAVFAIPPKPGPRAPRPDDPLPREPPTRMALKRTGSFMPVRGGIQRASSLKRAGSILGGTAGAKKTLAFGRVRSEVVIRGLGDGVDMDTPLTKGKVKEPTSSAKGKKGKGKGKADVGDPFIVSGTEDVDPGTVLPKMMARVKSGGAGAGVGAAGGEEAANKTMIKRLAQSALETYGILKEDDGFKTVYGYVTRGVEFAFRNKLKRETIGRDELRKMVVRHVEMYVGGDGEVTPLA